MIAWAERVAVGVLLVALAVGASAIALTTPGLTRALVVWSGAPADAGLEPDAAVSVAEDVRAYVTGAFEEALPTTVDGRSGFSEDAVRHLDDVAAVLSIARLASAFSAALLAGWLSLSLARRRGTAIVRCLKTGAVLSGALVAVAAGVALSDFDAFFGEFHGLFFEPGTWVFPSGTLLVELFPERFWAAMGALWGMLVTASALLMWVAAHTLERRGTVVHELAGRR